jgi:hypothetical protein
MRVIAIADNAGNISTMMTYDPNGPRPGVALPPDSQAVELEVPELAGHLKGTALAKKLKDVREQHRLDPGSRKLVRKG